MRVQILILILAGTVLALTASVDAAAAAKSKPAAAKATGAAAAASKADAEAEVQKPRRAMKDWAKLSDKDFRDLEDQWMEDEEEEPEDEAFKWRKGPNGERMPPEHKGPKMEMAFATLKPGTTKDETEEIAKKWQQLLTTDATPIKCYPIEDDKILLGVDGGYRDMHKVREFVLDQPELIEFEWQQQKSKPNHLLKAGGGGKQPMSEEQKKEAARKEKEAEIRRKLETGELWAEKQAKDKADAAAKQKAAKPKSGDKQKEKTKTKQKQKTKEKEKPKDKPKERAKPKSKDEL